MLEQRIVDQLRCSERILLESDLEFCYSVMLIFCGVNRVWNIKCIDRMALRSTIPLPGNKSRSQLSFF
jgi:hypothetical protein